MLNIYNFLYLSSVTMSPFNKIYHSIRRVFRPNLYKIQSFTFYIPSPPPRKVGYREKEFDKLFYNFINHGYEILNFKTQNNSGTSHSGMWVIFIVRSTTGSTAALDLDDDIELGDDYEKEVIEGLYQINDNNDFI